MDTTVGKKGKKRGGGAGSGGISMARRTSDRKWLESGGLTRPHTKEGIAAAKRLITVNSVYRDALRRYLLSAPIKPSPQSSGASKSVRTVSGGLPGLGKRR
jgi:hypothetical protein